MKTHYHREVAQKYCPFVDENVIVLRDADTPPDEYKCLTPHLCGEFGEGCKRRRKSKQHLVKA